MQVGLMDVDICGPSVPRMMGVEGQRIPNQSSLGWSPVYVEDNLAVMSVGFLMGEDADDAIVWRGPKKHGHHFSSHSDVDVCLFDFFPPLLLL